MVKRGEVWLVNLDPTVGSEIRKSRPCIIISPQELNEHLKTVIVAPMTSQGFAAPFRIGLRFQHKDGLILLDQIRTLDKSRLIRRMGKLSTETLKQTLQTLREVFEA
jgi:mRNA interferase MazF